MEVTHTKTGTKQACPDCKAQKLKCDPSHGVWSAGRVFQTSAGYLRVRVVEGDPISTTLMAGETPYLSAVAAIQLAQYKNRELDEESETLIADHSRGLAPSEYSRLNCLDPCLFPANERSEIQQERQAFYCKVWKLFNHFKHQISFKESRDQMQLMLTRPNYSTLEVLVCVRRFEVPGKEKRLLLGKGDTEDSCYTLSRRSIVDDSDSASTDHVTDHLRPRRNAPDRHQTSSQAFRNENNKRVRADEDILAGSCQPSSKNAKESHLTWASSSTSSLQPYGDAKSSIPSTTAEHIPTPHVSSLTLLNTPFEAESLSKKGKGTEQSEKDEEVKEDEEDKEKKRVEQISRNDDKSGRSNMSLVNDLLINGHDIPMGTSLGTLDQAVDMKQEYPTGSRQMYQPQPASTVVFPCTDPSWYTGAVAHQRNKQQAEITTLMPIVNNFQGSCTTLLDENTKAKQLRDFGTDSTNSTYNDSAPDKLQEYCWDNTLSSAASYNHTMQNSWEQTSNATSAIPPQYLYHHYAPGGPTHYQSR